MAHTYILYSNSANKFYVGATKDDLADRLRRHNTNHKGFTGGRGDWTLCYAESYDTIEQAMAREREIKGWKSRVKIERLCKAFSSAGSEHPD